MLFIFAILPFTACQLLDEDQTNENHNIESAEILNDTDWDLIAIDGEKVPSELKMRLKITADEVKGFDGCNEFWSPDFDLNNKHSNEKQYEYEIAQTLEGCYGIHELSDSYQDRVFTSNDIMLNEQSLKLTSNIGSLEFRKAKDATLENTTWSLESLTERGPMNSKLTEAIIDGYLILDFIDYPRYRNHPAFQEMYFQIDDHQISGFGSCNTLEGEVSGHESEITMLVSTSSEDICTEQFAIREKEFVAMFQHIDSFHISRQQLTFWNAKGVEIARFVAND